MFTIKKTAIAASVAIALGATALPVTSMAASAPMPVDTAVSHDGIYGQVLGGLGYTPSINYADSIDTLKVTFKKPSWDLGAALGYKTGNLRFEGEFMYFKSDVKDMTIDGVNLNQIIGGMAGSNQVAIHENVSVSAGIANAYYDFNSLDASGKFTPYLGLGVGVAHVKVKAYASLNGQKVAGASESSSSNKVAGQAIAGIAYNINDKTALTLDYRYFSTGKINDFDKRYQNNSVNLGLVYRFDTPENLA
jgi:opacity protein-like surface antigen